jgi:hypothetical protein
MVSSLCFLHHQTGWARKQISFHTIAHIGWPESDGVFQLPPESEARVGRYRVTGS